MIAACQSIARKPTPAFKRDFFALLVAVDLR
jgi:hypothetical protein